MLKRFWYEISRMFLSMFWGLIILKLKDVYSILLQIIHQPDEYQDFLSTNTIKDFNHLGEERFSLNDFEFKTNEDYIIE